MIIESFLHKDFSAFPPTWTRLNTDTAKGADGLARELGDSGHMFAVFKDGGDPIACTGVLPFRGENWINDAEKEGDAKVAKGEVTKIEGVSNAPNENSIPDWETCCFCVHPSQRGQGLTHLLLAELVAFIKPKGAKRLLSNYAIEETGELWPRLGFEVIPGAGGMLPKGFQTDPNKEGLREDIHFKMGAKAL